MLETDFHVLRVGETLDGRLCAEIREGDAVIKRSFFWPPYLAPREKNKGFIPHRFLSDNAFRHV